MRRVTLPPQIETEQSVYEYRDALVESGWTWIGGGFFAAVYVHPKKPCRVLKVADGDRAYETFLTYALAYQCNPFMPKIYSVKRFSSVWDEYTVVELERLQPLSEVFDRSRKDYRCADSLRNKMELYGSTGETPRISYAGKFHSWKSPHEMQAAAILSEVFRQERGDLHSGNVMLRGRQLVITDPAF